MTAPVRLEDRPYVRALTRQCARCGSAFIASPLTLRRRINQRYCSNRCRCDAWIAKNADKVREQRREAQRRWRRRHGATQS